MLVFCASLFLVPLVEQARRPLVAIDAYRIPKTIQVSSHTFANGGLIPFANSAYGANISPDLEWKGLPANTQSVLLLVQDPDTAQGLYTHWILYNMQPTTKGLPKGLPFHIGTLPQGLQGENDSAYMGYFGPRPPDAAPHHYHFQVFAMKAWFRRRPGFDTGTIYKAIKDFAICGGDLVGVFKKP
jgi:Raf kinase inhibitor-like YbhB/YbcL family protein